MLSPILRTPALPDTGSRQSLPRVPDCRLVVCGAHGGAGTTTLAALLQPALDAGVIQPGTAGRTSYAGVSAGPLLIACRPTTWSATLATAAVATAAREGLAVDVLVVTGDGWPETSVAAARYRLLSAQVGAIVRMPFVPALRGCTDPSSIRLPRRAHGALRRIRSLTAASVRTRPVAIEVSHEHD